MPSPIPEVMIDVVIAEAIGEGDMGMAQVAQVMFNRSESRGKTLEQVVTAPQQFEGYKSPNADVEKDMEDPATRARVEKLINDVAYGRIKVPYPDADHFHTNNIAPKWSKTGELKNSGTLGNHKFYSSPRSRKVAAKRTYPNAPKAEKAPAPKAPTPPVKSADVEDQTSRGTTVEIGYAPKGNQAPAPTNPALQAIEAVAPGTGASRSPFTQGGRENIEKSRESAKLKYNNQGAKRNLSPSQILENEIIDAVTDVYGPGYEVSVISGRQEKGVSRGMVGTRRHTTGTAADVFVYDSDGDRVTGDALVPVAQHWLASGKGSIGFPAKAGHSMHMDLVGGKGEGAVKSQSGEGKLWYYGNPSQSQSSALSAARDKKVGPKVMAKNTPTPPRAGAADEAREAYKPKAKLREVSNLNTREQSEQAALAATGKPREVSNKVLASQGDPDIMAKVRGKSSTKGDPDIMEQFAPTPSVPKKTRAAKASEIEDPMMAGIGTLGAQKADRPSSTQTFSGPAGQDYTSAPTQEVVQQQAAAPDVQEVDGSPNFIEQLGQSVQSKFTGAIDNATDKIQGIGQGIQEFADNPYLKTVGTIRQGGAAMGNRVRDKLQPLADFLEGPDYDEVKPNEGWRDKSQRDSGSNVVAVGPSGTRRVNIDQSDRDRERDRNAHGDQDMAAYRANKAVFDKYGLRMTSSNSKKLQEMGETLYVPKSSESKYQKRREDSGQSDRDKQARRDEMLRRKEEAERRRAEREARREERKSNRSGGFKLFG